MSSRPVNLRRTKDSVFLEMAVSLSKLGTCDRAYVGAIITRLGRAVSWGYNGAPPGAPHCHENKHGWYGQSHEAFQALYDLPGGPGEKEFEELAYWQDQQATLQGCRNATHAEANALAFAAREGISTDKGTLYVTVSPCESCARLLIAAGISRVVYANAYRDASGLTVLHSSGISTIHLVMP